MSDDDLHLDDIPTVADSEATKAAALHTVCAYAEDVAEAVRFAKMLGIAPSPPPPPAMCKECGRQMAKHARQGYVTKGAEGLCSRCYSKETRARKRVAR